MPFRAILASLVLAGLALFPPRFPAHAQVPGRCEILASERPSEVGCYLLDSVVIGPLVADPVYWHLYSFPTRLGAEEAKVGASVALEAFGQGWLFAIAGPDWRPSGGTRVGVFGPLSVTPDRPYTARYMQSTLTPGLRTRIHRHAGAELFYVLEGAPCLETPSGRLIARAGASVTAPPGTFMELSTYGPDTLRALILVLHDSNHPWVDRTPADWQPQGLCAA